MSGEAIYVCASERADKAVVHPFSHPPSRTRDAYQPLAAEKLVHWPLTNKHSFEVGLKLKFNKPSRLALNAQAAHV